MDFITFSSQICFSGLRSNFLFCYIGSHHDCYLQWFVISGGELIYVELNSFDKIIEYIYTV